MKTKQRKIILEELQKLTSHPTADELYAIVRKQLPNISLGTVYRNLNQMTKDGIILKLGKAGQQKRFDANTNQHYHFNCETCDKIYDLSISTIKQIEKTMADITQHEVQGYDLEFYGHCSYCKTKGGKNHD
jgi:Fe2+ or Zn2+ uptake regulation protein